MNQQNLRHLLKQLKQLTNELESEIYSDPESYVLNLDYSDVLNYHENNDDDDWEGL